MAERISRKADTLTVQCHTASAGITAAGAGWPAGAPTSIAMEAHADGIDAKLLAVAGAEAALRTELQELRDLVKDAREDMQKVDQATDLLYGPDGAEKLSFGIEPKQSGGGVPGGGGAPPPLPKVIIRVVRDGAQSKSLFVDFESIEGAVYQAQWFSDAPLLVQVGDVTITQSEFTATGLTAGQQYWFRVRAVRGGEYGQWSDQATRVANV